MTLLTQGEATPAKGGIGTPEPNWFASYADGVPKSIDPASGTVQNSNDPPWDSAWPALIDPPPPRPREPGPVGPAAPSLRSCVELSSSPNKSSAASHERIEK